MRELTLRSLRVFEAAASTSSFSRAAELMAMSQPAVSQQIRQLEEEAGLRLFDTHARPIQLTDAGRELLRHARAILAQVEVAADAMSSLEGQFKGQIHLGVVSPAQYFAPAMLTAFRERYPQVRVKLSIAQRDTLLAQLAEHKLDLVIGGYPPAHAEVEAEAFARHPHVLVASSSHPLAHQPGLQWADLRQEPFLFREPGSSTRQFLEQLMMVQGLQVQTAIELQGPETIRQAVMAGMGISFMSAHVCQTEISHGLIRVLDVAGMPKWLDWCLLYRRDRPLSSVQQALREFVLAEGAALAACVLG